jgi:hypothetical protein
MLILAADSVAVTLLRNSSIQTEYGQCDIELDEDPVCDEYQKIQGL